MCSSCPAVDSLTCALSFDDVPLSAYTALTQLSAMTHLTICAAGSAAIVAPVVAVAAQLTGLRQLYVFDEPQHVDPTLLLQLLTALTELEDLNLPCKSRGDSRTLLFANHVRFCLLEAWQKFGMNVQKPRLWSSQYLKYTCQSCELVPTLCLHVRISCHSLLVPWLVLCPIPAGLPMIKP